MASNAFVFVCSYLNMGLKKHPTAREETQVCFRFHTQTKFDISCRKQSLINLANHEECGDSEMLKEALKSHVPALNVILAYICYLYCIGIEKLVILS